ncbi:MAG: DUF3987 domain-containing protein [Thiohalospira sp.]
MTKIQNPDEKREIIHSFPKGIFPNIIEKMLDRYYNILNLNRDYIGAAVLIALSLACGNYAKIKIKNGWIESPILWMVLVGKAGINKSSPLDIFLKPFKKKNNHYYKLYKKELLKYEQNLKNNKKKTQNENDDNSGIKVAPVRKQFLLSDFTPESLALTHENNPHGIVIYTDEILTWLKNFNRYNSSGEEQFYLSTWSGREININRRTSSDIYISNPFIGVCGTIQPAKFPEAFGKGRDKSGFTHRFLFAYPNKVIRKAFDEDEISESDEFTYNKIIDDLLIISSNNGYENPKIYDFDDNSKKGFKEWRDINNDRINNESNDDLTGIYSKLEIYLPRIALILQIVEDNLYGKNSNKYISLNSLESAIRLINYFEYTAIKVYRQVSKYNDPLNNYPNDKKEFYKALPPVFSTKEAERIAHNLNIPRRSIFEFFKDDVLFEKTKHGQYNKKV